MDHSTRERLLARHYELLSSGTSSTTVLSRTAFNSLCKKGRKKSNAWRVLRIVEATTKREVFLEATEVESKGYKNIQTVIVDLKPTRTMVNHGYG